jgi:hypothetical protein
MRRIRPAGAKRIAIGCRASFVFALFAAGSAAAMGCPGAAFTAGSDVRPGPRIDAGDALESGATDTAPPEEAAPPGDAEAGSPEGGQADGPVTWCSTQAPAALCDDFDSLPLPSAFAKEEVTVNSLLTYDTSDVRSSPNALLARTAETPASTSNETALLMRSFPLRAGTHFELQLELEITASCLTGTDTVAPLALSFANYGLALVAGATSAELVELPPGQDAGPTPRAVHLLKAAVFPGRWFTLAMSARLGVENKVDMTIDGTPVLTGETMNALPPTPPQHPTLAIGASTTATAAAGTACTVHVDNVLFDILP